MAQDQQRLSPIDRDNLVAYIDGELSERESRALATKITLSATAHREVEALKRTWELLEYLPRPAASSELTERTLTEVRRIDALGGRLESLFVRRAKRVLRLALWAGAALIGVALGFAVMRWVWPDPTARLLRDLSIAEHFDEYRDVGDLEFLKALANTPEFSAESRE